ATLDYPFPSVLSGVSDQRVSFRGSVTEPGVAELSGAPGSARCAFSTEVVRCSEMVPSLMTDPASALQMLQNQPLSELERMARADVIQLFAADPIGVLTFAAENRGHGADD